MTKREDEDKWNRWKIQFKEKIIKEKIIKEKIIKEKIIKEKLYLHISGS